MKSVIPIAAAGLLVLGLSLTAAAAEPQAGSSAPDRADAISPDAASQTQPGEAKRHRRGAAALA